MGFNERWRWKRIDGQEKIIQTNTFEANPAWSSLNEWKEKV